MSIQLTRCQAITALCEGKNVFISAGIMHKLSCGVQFHHPELVSRRTAAKTLRDCLPMPAYMKRYYWISNN